MDKEKVVYLEVELAVQTEVLKVLRMVSSLVASRVEQMAQLQVELTV